jgi:hypothetical protein
MKLIEMKTIPSEDITRKKATQWSFTLPSFSSEDIDRISNLPPADVLYITFAICNDDTGNCFLQGFVKTAHRRRVGPLVRLIGWGVFTICPTPTCVRHTIMEIQMNRSFKEFGDVAAAQFQGFRKDVIAFKTSAAAGLNIDELKTLYPNICARYPGLVLKCVSPLQLSVS